MARRDIKNAPKSPTAEGFQDPSGAYPLLAGRDKSSVNPGTRKTFKNQNTRGPRSSLTHSGSSTDVILPTSGRTNPEYPYNNITQTPGGHVIEYDDTPGYERIHIQHVNGSSITMYTNGDTEIVSEGSAYSVTAKNHNVTVRGICNIIVESDANIRVKGNSTIETQGNHNHTVYGDYNLSVNGDYNVMVNGDYSEEVVGERLEQTRGNVIQWHLNNASEMVVGDKRVEIGGNYNYTGEGSYNVRTYGEVQMAYYGGVITLNGKDKEENIGEGEILSNKFYGVDAHLTNAYIETAGHIAGTLTVGSTGDFGGQVTASTVHATTFEGTAKKADYATQAGTAGGTGSVTATTPSPNSAETPTNRLTGPLSTLAVTDVTGSAAAFLINLDESIINGGFNTRHLSTSEVISRCRNNTLRKNGTWLQTQISLGNVNESITSVPNLTSRRVGSRTAIMSGSKLINSNGLDNFIRKVSKTNSTVIPSSMEITEIPGMSKRLSPNFYLSHFIGTDSESSKLVSQLGISEIAIAKNLQITAYSILEKLRRQYNDTFTISEGLYTLLPNEKLDPNSFAYDRAIGLGIGIQFPAFPNSYYFDVAQWCYNNLNFEKLALSYIDYDPSEINEPTLLISVRSGLNSQTVYTEINHNIVSNTLEDYS